MLDASEFFKKAKMLPFLIESCFKKRACGAGHCEI
jgi:hypothetical protein